MHVELGDPGPTPVAYGSFFARLRALLADAAIVILCVFGVVVLFELTADVPGSGLAAVIAIVGVVLLYEPVMVARYGGTFGHRWSNLRIVDERSGDPPSFARAALRYLLKSVLGLLSFVTMALTRRHQAMHDGLTRTTVRIHDLERARPAEVRWERDAAEVPGLPSRTRRVAVILAYVAALFVLLSISTASFTSDACAFDDLCTAGEDAVLTVGGLAWMALSAGCIVAGWKGRLRGARARPAREAVV